ncbi:MAG TPA: septum site-determining protein MinC [Clostridiaceae bacterium]
MLDDNLIIKGTKGGINAVINMDKFKDFEEMMGVLVEKLSKGKAFYKGASLIITTDLKKINSRDFNKLKEVLFDEFELKDCTLEAKMETDEFAGKAFSGIHEGRTKFLRRTVRSGEVLNYQGNIVIVGDVNAGSQISAGGNIIVLGVMRGSAHAGNGGNPEAIVAAYSMQPEILQIANLMTRAPEEANKPAYPEVAKIKDGTILVEPYLPNKFK